MNHDELVVLAERWLRRKHRVVVRDVRCTVVSEQPDAIGWTGRGASTLIECKTSRADFVRDAMKSFRRVPETGMGMRRYFLAPAGVLRAASLPPRWGLLEATAAGKVDIVRKAVPFETFSTLEERRLLLSALARATEGWGRRMFGEAAPPLVDGDPHPSAAATIAALRAEVLALREERRAKTGGAR